MDNTQLARYQADRAALATGRNWKPKDGDNLVRILPQPAGVEPRDIYTRVATHFSVGAKKRATECARERNEACAVCDYIDAQTAQGQNVADITADVGFEFHIIDLATFDANAPEYKAQVWRGSPFQTKQVLGYLCDANWGDISDPVTGKVCKINKDSKSGRTSYQISFQPQACPIDLTRVKYQTDRMKHTYEQQNMILQGVDPSDMPSATPAGQVPAATMPAPAVATPLAIPPSPLATPNFPVAAPPAIPGGMPAPAAMPVPAMPAAPPMAVPAPNLAPGAPTQYRDPASPAPAAAPTRPAPAGPPVPAAPPVPAIPASAPPVMADTKSYWVSIDGQSVKKTGDEIRTYLVTNSLPASQLPTMSLDHESGWKTAAEFDLG